MPWRARLCSPSCLGHLIPWQCGLGSYGERNYVTINHLHTGVMWWNLGLKFVGLFEGPNQKKKKKMKAISKPLWQNGPS